MATIDDLRELGYTVEEAVRLEDPDIVVYRVDGHGISTQIRTGPDATADDEAAVEQLADPAGHVERVKQQDETQEQTMLRWHDDPRHPTVLPAEQVDQLRERVTGASS